MVNEQAYYKNGLQKSVYQTHSWRTVQNSMNFVIPLLKPTDSILDVGCGPGTITLDYGNYVPQGSVIGVEPTQGLIDVSNDAQKQAGGVSNVKFQIGSIYNLPFEDNSFDVVVAHQVVVHLEDPVSALRELKRVVKPSGLVCVKDGDLKAAFIYPQQYEEFFHPYVASMSSNGKPTSPIAGRSLRERALNAGYSPAGIKISGSVWTISDEPEKSMWVDMFVNRLENAGERLSGDDATDSELRKKAIDGWRKWGSDDAAYLAWVHGELVYKKEAN